MPSLGVKVSDDGLQPDIVITTDTIIKENRERVCFISVKSLFVKIRNVSANLGNFGHLAQSLLARTQNF